MKSKRTHVDNDTFNELATRRSLIADCTQRFGPEGARQLRLLFDKWDKAIASCKNENEVKHMKAMAAAEIYTALGYSGGITVGGQVVIPAEDTGPKPISNA